MIFTREYKKNWNLFNKISFRFLIIYFALYGLSGFTGSLWQSLVYWLGENVFSISYEYSSKGYGSGDTTYQYIQTFLFICLSVFTALIWSLADYKRKSYNQANYGFMVYLRIVLVYYLLVYGLIKVFHIQMIPPTYSQLTQTLGEISPMGLAWIFMGFSKGYSMFAGGVEVLAALLLVPRRTQFIGSLITIAVMAQVFIMNLCFDIPVKLFSFHLLLMGIILFLSDFKRYSTFLFSSKSIAKNTIYPTRNSEAKKVIPVLKGILVIGFLAFFSLNFNSRSKRFTEKLNPYLAGVWKVTSFKNTSLTPTISSYHDNVRWKNLIVSSEGSMITQMMNDSLVHYKTQIDSVSKNITFSNSNANFKINYTLGNSKSLQLSGIIANDTLTIKLTRKTKKDFLLTSRGFHWVNEIPLNK